MAKKANMTVEEAQWKLERELVKQGYSMNGQWTSRYHKGEQILCLSRNLTGYHEHVRAVLWPEGKKWIGGISILIENYGEYLLSYGEVLSKGDTFTPQAHRLMKKRVEILMPKMLEWKYWSLQFAKEKAHLVLIHLALEYIRASELNRAIAVLLMAARGEIVYSTIHEAMEMVQMRFGRSVQDYAVISQIFEKVFNK